MTPFWMGGSVSKRFIPQGAGRARQDFRFALLQEVFFVEKEPGLFDIRKGALMDF